MFRRGVKKFTRSISGAGNDIDNRTTATDTPKKRKGGPEPALSETTNLESCSHVCAGKPSPVLAIPGIPGRAEGAS